MKADTQENPTLSSASILVSKLEEVASNKSFNVKEKRWNFDDADFKERRKGQLAIDAEIFRDYTFFSCGGSDQNNLGHCLKISLKDVYCTDLIVYQSTECTKENDI